MKLGNLPKIKYKKNKSNLEIKPKDTVKMKKYLIRLDYHVSTTHI